MAAFLRKSFAKGNRRIFRALYGLSSRGLMRAARTSGGRYAPHPPSVPVRPFRRRVGTAKAPSRVLREARSAAEVWPARRVADAVFYLLRSGCAWRMLPREYPPWQTVYYHFRRWRLDGRLRSAHAALRVEVRAREGRARDPSAAVIDSQAVKTSRVGGPERGYDGAKRLAGRKRHILVDTNGLVLAARVHGADLPDRDGGRQLLAVDLQREVPRLELVWAEGAYTRECSASGRATSEGGGWKCRITVTGSCGATDCRRSLGGFSGPAAQVGGVAHLRLAEPGTTSEQGLRASARDGRSHDLRGDESDHAAQAGAGGVKDFTPAPPIRSLQNSFLERVLQ